MKAIADDSKVVKVESPSVTRERPSSPNASNMMENLLDNLGLQKQEGGSA